MEPGLVSNLRQEGVVNLILGVVVTKPQSASYEPNVYLNIIALSYCIKNIGRLVLCFARAIDITPVSNLNQGFS
jgi:hypothetical protein